MLDDARMFSVAMGNAREEATARAGLVTARSTEERFSRDVEETLPPEGLEAGDQDSRDRQAKKKSEESVPHVVVVGAGFAGLLAARGLRDAPVRLTVIDRQNHHLFQPLLYQVATAGLGPNEIACPIRSVFRRQQNATVMMAEVKSVDLRQRLLTIDDGARLSYDYLIVAAGAKPSYFGHDEWSSFAPALKSLEDALEISRRLLLSLERAEHETDGQRQKELLTFVVVGGGPTGVELAGALSELLRGALRRDFRTIHPDKARVVLLEAGPAVLPSFPITLQQKATQYLEKLGVTVRVSTHVDAVDADGVMVQGVRIAAGTVLWAAGVEGSPLAASLGVPLDRTGRVIVTRTLNVPGYPEVFVVGDLAALHQGGRAIPGVATAAMQEGRYAARAIRQLLAVHAVAQPFHFRNKGELATVGRGHAVASLPGRIYLWGSPAWLLWMGVHVFYLIGFGHRLTVMLEWAWAYVSRRSRAQIITSALPSESDLTESSETLGAQASATPARVAQLRK